ncbi:MAG: SagB/ThcOx family dehydrogenase [Methanosarcinaceae archaeon]|nr:SagB/ThcOx family dehydrogenase [Methanosarcinaceae archaeon]
MGNQGLSDLPMKLKLPLQQTFARSPIEKVLAKRRSVRSYSEKEFTERDAARFLWAAQGISSAEGFRTAPSAGAFYPLEIRLIAGKVQGLESGVYRYLPNDAALLQELKGDFRADLSKAALSQPQILNAPANLLISAIYPRITSKYLKRGIRYTHMEAGHAAQNVCLLAADLGFGTCPIGAFEDEEVQKILKLPINDAPLYILPLGRI